MSGYFYSFQDNSFFNRVKVVLEALRGLQMLAALIINSSVVSCVLLLGDDARERASNTFRAAFITLTAFDIFVGIERGYGGAEYLQSIVFNFVGALLLGVFAPFFVGRVYPAARQHGRNIAVESN